MARSRLLFEVVVRLDAVGRLDHGHHRLAPVRVQHAEHGDVADLQVGEELGLDLGRVDVHAAADDHVDLAVT